MKRPVTRLLLSVLLISVALGSLLFSPAHATHRFRPVPAHAQLVYNNTNPDWFLSFFPMFGKMNDEFSRSWEQHFGGVEKRPLTVATIPGWGGGNHNAWVAVSELGGSTALALRWRLMLRPPEGVAPVRPYAAWAIWKLEHPALPAWAHVRFCLTDGLLICSVSPDSRDIYKLIDTLDGRAASLADKRSP